MWFWITIFAVPFIGLFLLEETINYFWNRYLYGPNEKKENKVKEVLGKLINFIKNYKRGHSY